MRNLLLALLLFSVCPLSQAEEDLKLKSTTVAGFINLGDKKDSGINTELTKSLITYLKKAVPEADITPYGDVEKLAGRYLFWESGKLDPSAAIQIARDSGSRQLVAGEYTVNGQDNTIYLKVYLYDADNGHLMLERSYNGLTGINLFDTIDLMVKNISGLITGNVSGKGRVLLKVTSPEDYVLFTNGNKAGGVSNLSPFSAEFPAGENLSLTLQLSGKVVYEKTVKPAAGTTNELVYDPAAVEGPPPAYPGLFYRNSWPAMDFLLPGFAQFQAGDWGMGTLFSVSGFCGAGLTVFSIAGYNIINGKLSAMQGNPLQQQYENDAVIWGSCIAGGGLLWLLSGGLSAFHAFIMKDETAGGQKVSLSLEYQKDSKRAMVAWSDSF